jgi:hypothetical protein
MLPETLLTVNDILAVRWISGDNLLLAFVASPFVQLSLIPQRQTPFLPAFRTIFWPWEILFLIEFLLLFND